MSFFFFSLVNGQVSLSETQPGPSKSTVYPNPARAFIHIQHFHTGKEPIKLIVYNFLGNKQLELTRPAKTIQLDLSEFKRGIYIFQFRDLQDRIIETGKFQVEK